MVVDRVKEEYSEASNPNEKHSSPSCIVGPVLQNETMTVYAQYIMRYMRFRYKLTELGKPYRTTYYL